MISEKVLREIGDEAGVVVISQAILFATHKGDRELTCIPRANWESLARQMQTPITKALEKRDMEWSLELGADVIHAIGVRFYDTIMDRG